jgi:N-acetyl sugar amidotransferase
MDIKYKFPKLDIDEKKYAEALHQIKDAQIPNLPKEIRFCAKCVTSNQRPRTEFDAEGVCSACRYAEKKFGGGIDWEAREKELEALLAKHRSSGASWDVVVPGSGGKDSALVTHQLKARYGMNPLSVTWAPFIYTDIGWQNYYNFIQNGFDGLVAWPNAIIHRKLARICFEMKGDPFEPFAIGQKAYGFRIAQKFNIPLMFYGENGDVEYGGTTRNANKAFESPAEWEELYMKGAGLDAIVREGINLGIFSEEEIKHTNFDFYRAPPIEEIEKLGLEMHWWSYYKLWVPQENFYYATKYTGFEPAEERTQGTYSKHTSIDDQIDPFHWLFSYIKFGQGRATREASSEIRCGHITREEGVALVQRYDHEFPDLYLQEFLQYLDITEEHFWEVVNRYHTPHVWHKDGDVWKLNKVVSNNSLEGEVPSEEMTPYCGAPSQKKK